MRKQLSPLEREYIQEELRYFEETVPMTLPERNALRRWVWNGNVINSNPWGYTYGGEWQMNYLEALRMDDTIYELIKKEEEEI